MTKNAVVACRHKTRFETSADFKPLS